MGKCLLYNAFPVPIKQTSPFMTGSFVLVTNKLYVNLISTLEIY